jgi:hypothetical protein
MTLCCNQRGVVMHCDFPLTTHSHIVKAVVGTNRASKKQADQLHAVQ